MTSPSENRITPLVETLRTGALDLDAYLSELRRYFDSQEQRIEAFIPEPGRFERLAEDSRRLSQGDDKGPLYGVPVGVKDIIHVDGFDTTAGSGLPADALAGPQAACVTRLTRAGALILGKTVTTEFAYFGPGPTRNPHNTDHTPGGSSSGSAAAVGAGVCPLALGSQTVGSVIRPAAFCGVVGFKPTYGRIPIDGVIPYSPTVDTLGFFTTDVAGAVVVASVLCDDWAHLPATTRTPVLGVPRGPYLDHADATGRAHFDAVIAKLEQAGYEVKTVDAFSDFDELAARHEDLIAGEFAIVHREWFDRFGDLYRKVTADQIGRGRNVSAERLDACRRSPARLRVELESLMDASGLDAWICPPAPGAPPRTIKSTGNPVMNMPWTHAGMPVITMPSGWTEDSLPMGLQIASRSGSDEQLMAWAGPIERALS